MTMNVINAVAQFERDLFIERTQAGLARWIPSPSAEALRC
jgi:DNA invertase Pin-like site-specific DNA recombinase